MPVFLAARQVRITHAASPGPPLLLQFYWQEKGQDVSIVNAVAAIDNCLREPIGRGQCSNIRGELE